MDRRIYHLKLIIRNLYYEFVLRKIRYNQYESPTTSPYPQANISSLNFLYQSILRFIYIIPKYTLPETNSLPLKIGLNTPKRKFDSSSNHWFSWGFREGINLISQIFQTLDSTNWQYTTTYILPIGWLYGTYHLLREPGNSIDSTHFRW